MVPWPMPSSATASQAAAAPSETASSDDAADGTSSTTRARRAGAARSAKTPEHDPGGHLGGADQPGGDGGVEVGPAVVGEIGDEVHDRRAHRADRQRERDRSDRHRRVRATGAVACGLGGRRRWTRVRCAGRPGSTRRGS